MISTVGLYNKPLNVEQELELYADQHQWYKIIKYAILVIVAQMIYHSAAASITILISFSFELNLDGHFSNISWR